MWSLTSGNSSLSMERNMGSRCSIVLAPKVRWRARRLDCNRAYASFPRIGASPLIWVPKAALTCWEVSDTRPSMPPMMLSSSTLRSTRAQKPGIWPAMAVRASASLSLSNLMNAGTRSLETTSSSTAFAIYSRTSLLAFGAIPPSFSHSATTHLLETISNHVSHTPALVLYKVAQRSKQNAMAGLLLLGNNLSNRNQNINGK